MLYVDIIMYMATWVAPAIFLSSNPPLPSLALVLDRDHELVGLVDQVGRRGEHRVWPESGGNFASEIIRR